MTRRRQQYRKKLNNVPLHEREAVEGKPEPAPLTFRQACRQLWKVIKFKTLPSKYLNKKVRYKGKWYKIEGETADFFFIREFPKQSFPKEENKLPIR